MLLLNYKRIELPFEYPFELSKGLKTKQPALLVSLGLGSLRGYGETTEIAYYEQSNIDHIIEVLESKRSMIQSYAINSPHRFFHFLHHLIPDESFLMSALDMAAWDLWAKINWKSVQQLIGIELTGNEPETNYTIGIHHPDEVVKIVKEKLYSIYKIKVGNKDDMSVLEALRKATDATIRIDANEGWTLDMAKEILPILEAYKIELIEQPFNVHDKGSLIQFKEMTSIPIIADEACKKKEDLDWCLLHYDGVNVKLSKFGGITPALNTIKKIKAAGKKVMLGGMCESTIGATAVAQLLPFADYVDIDGPLLLKENFGKSGLVYEGGKIILPRKAGLGVII